MAIFSRRKGSKTKVDDDGTTSHHSIKKPRLEQVRNTSSASTSDITLARAPGSQRSDSLKPLRPALSRTTRSDSSMYLTMHAVNNRLKMSSSSIDAEFSSLNPWIDADKKPGSRSPSPKKVSFNIDDEPIKPDRKRPASNSPLSTPPLTAVDSEVTRDDASSIYSASSSEYSDTSECIELPVTQAPPRKPKHVARDFQRKMDRLPPVRRHDTRPRPKVTLVHSKDGQPSWLVKSTVVAAH